jgi:inosose dehydratase
MKNREWPRLPRVWTDVELFRRLGTLRQEAERNELVITNVFCDGEYINPESAAAEHDQAVVVAHFIAAAGGRHLLVTGGPRRTGSAHEADLAALAENLSRTARETLKVGVRLCLHPHIDTAVETPGDIDAFFARSGEEVALALDTAHVAAGGGDPEAIARRFSSRLEYIHLKDILMPSRGELAEFAGVARFAAFRDLGEGNVNLIGFCHTVEELGFAGPVIAELDATNNPGESARVARQYIRDQIGW